MILQVYDKNSCTLIDNVDEAKVFETYLKIPKKDVTDWENDRLIQECKVFSFVNQRLINLLIALVFQLILNDNQH